MIWTQMAMVAAALIVAGLAGYALWLWWRLWRQRRRQRELALATRGDQINSLRILARAVDEGELNVTEAAIRLKVMLDYLLPNAGAAHYPAIYALFEATAHMPRRLERRRRPAVEIARLDAEREHLERIYEERVVAEARQLLEEYSG